jgi:hypothetical protein
MSYQNPCSLLISESLLVQCTALPASQSNAESAGSASSSSSHQHGLDWTDAATSDVIATSKRGAYAPLDLAAMAPKCVHHEAVAHFLQPLPPPAITFAGHSTLCCLRCPALIGRRCTICTNIQMSEYVTFGFPAVKKKPQTKVKWSVGFM